MPGCQRPTVRKIPLRQERSSTDNNSEIGAIPFLTFNGVIGMKTISWEDFDKVELRVGTIVDVQDFPEARKPSYIVWVDFGEEIGMRKSSAQITHLYSKESLKGKQIVGVVNFPAKQIGSIRSEFLLTGFVLDTGEVVLAVPDKNVPNGLKLA